MTSLRRVRTLRAPLDALEPLEPRVLMTVGAMVEPELASSNQPGIGLPARLSASDSATTLSQIHAATGVELAHADYGLTGAGQTVVIIDSGVAYDHVALGGGLGPQYRVVGGWDFTEEQDADPYDDGPAGFHGTHVAGIIGSQDSVHTGVAPNVDMVALRVFNDQGRGKLSWLESSLDWVVEHQDAFAYPITTVNLSIGTDWNALTLPEYATLEDELADLDRLGIFVSVAAGNNFDPHVAGLSYPAISSHVTPVASSNVDGGMSDFSQRHRSSLVVPGEQITSTVPDYVEDFNGIADDFYAASGTSMAAPYVAGAAILVREAMQRAGHFEIAAQSVRQIMIDTADAVFDPVSGQPYQHLNVAAAIESILGTNSAVQHSGTTLIVRGTDGADEIHLDQYGVVHVNGETYRFSPEQIQKLELSGEAGHDRLVVDSRFDSSGVRFGPGSVEITGGRQTLEAEGFERIEVRVSGRNTTAEFLGSDRPDQLHMKPTHAWMEGSDFLNYIRGAESVRGWADDGNDKVTFYDSSGGDHLMSHPSASSLRGPGFENHGFGYSQVVVRATSGGFDQAEIVGTPTDDVVRAKPDYISLKSTSHFVYARGFDRIQVNGNGGHDAAKLYDSPGVDRVSLGTGSHSIVTPTTRTHLSGFTRVEAYATAGHDIAEIRGSHASEQFVAKPTHSWMTDADRLNYARGFERIVLRGGGGSDVARLYDSAADDEFRLGPGASSVSGFGFQFEVSAIARVHAVSRHGSDTARLAGSHSVDQLFATEQAAWIGNADYTAIAEGFRRVVASAKGDGDRFIIEEALLAYPVAGTHSWVAQSEELEVIAQGFLRT